MSTKSKGIAAKRHLLSNTTRDKTIRTAAKAAKAVAQATPSEEQLALMMPTNLYLFPIEVQKSVVAILAACGTPTYVLAIFLRMSQEAVNDNFGSTIAAAKQITNARVAGSLFNTALYEEDARSRTTAAIFWLKAQARWREDGSTPQEKVEVPNALPLAKLTQSQFERINKIVSEAAPEDRKAAEQPEKLIDVEPPKKKGGKKNGKA